MRMTVVVAALACSAMVCTNAMAQSRGRSQPAPRTGTADQETLPPSVPPAVSTLAPVRGIAGPRLEPGAVLCDSAADLQHRAEVTRKAADGDPDPGDPMAGCRMLNQQRGVEIVSRQGFGRVQVKVKPTGQVGWTDSYLP